MCVARCGGPGVCGDCSREAARYASSDPVPAALGGPDILAAIRSTLAAANREAAAGRAALDRSMALREEAWQRLPVGVALLHRYPPPGATFTVTKTAIGWLQGASRADAGWIHEQWMGHNWMIVEEWMHGNWKIVTDVPRSADA
jgi:hypothetical protein